MLSLVLGLAPAFFLRRSLQQLSLRAAPRHRLIASLWRARLSITLAREKFGLTFFTASLYSARKSIMIVLCVKTERQRNLPCEYPAGRNNFRHKPRRRV